MYFFSVVRRILRIEVKQDLRGYSFFFFEWEKVRRNYSVLVLGVVLKGNGRISDRVLFPSFVGFVRGGVDSLF